MPELQHPDRPPVRYRPIDRSTVSSVSLDEQLPQDDPVRLLWQFAVSVDLSAFHRPDKAREGTPGASVIPTTVLFSLWLLALSEGVASGRRLARLCRRDLPYQWLCGGLPVNYHTLNDFYSGNTQALHELFVEHVAVLRQHGLIELKRLTLDGRKVPAAVAKESLHRQPTLLEHRRQAQEHLDAVLAEQADCAAQSQQQQAARRRGATDRLQRLKKAIACVQDRQQQRQQTNRASVKPEEARASETDADVAKMKMPDGGYRPAYNVQTATDEPTGLIVSVAVNSQGSDNGLLLGMVDQVQQEQHSQPEQVLLDSGYSSQSDVQALEERGVQVLMPPKNEKKEQQQGKNPHAAKRRDTKEVARWRARMGDPEVRQLYRRRAPVAEGVHAQQSNRGFKRIRLRGLEKAQAEVLWQALVYNLKSLLARGVDLGGILRAG